MDLLDILNPAKSKFPFKGSYRQSLGENEEDLKKGNEHFIYKYENPQSAAYRIIFSDSQGSARSTAIRTNTRIKFEVGKFVILQDGTTYAITEIMKDFNSAPQQVFRITNSSPGIEYVLRLEEKENPWRLK